MEAHLTTDPSDQLEHSNASHEEVNYLYPPPKRFLLSFWCLAGVAVVLTAAIVIQGMHLITSGTSAAPTPKQPIHLPYESSPAWETIRSWVVQDDGRNKPFDTFAREAVRTITGVEKFGGHDPVAVVVSWMIPHESTNWNEHPFILCDYRPLRERIYQDYWGDGRELSDSDRLGKHIEPTVLRRSQALKSIVAGARAKKRRDEKAVLSLLEKKAKEVQQRFDLYERIAAGNGFGMAALDKYGRCWFTLQDVRDFLQRPATWERTLQARRIETPHRYLGKAPQPRPSEALEVIWQAYERFVRAYQEGPEARFVNEVDAFLAAVTQASQSLADYPAVTTTARELAYNRLNPFRQAWLAGLFAAVLFAASLALNGSKRLLCRLLYLGGFSCYLAVLGWAGYGFFCRVTISGRPPVSNMYESIIWVAFMTAVFGLVFELIYRQGVIGLAGAVVAVLGFVLADQMPMVFNPTIQPLQAVLRSNYWLVVHVLTIVSSYAAFALAWGLGNANLGLILFTPGRRDQIKMLSRFCYRCIQVGVLLLAAGTLLGGFWAAESWGRFWGWDPKEVWALIALLCYVIPLHARYVGWVKDFGLAVCSVVCFASVMMAWYGVNFILGAGLHSYGFGGGNDAWVYWAGMVNINLVVLAAMRYQYTRQAEVFHTTG
ncbi:MAG: hypothetical protein KatS3mg105_1124 [Gemmatales bacterium]|nr:MAG: hypothetical protein KatS3mg105_1124 [Gemmatales bacterium]